jgi:hypothetical protein
MALCRDHSARLSAWDPPSVVGAIVAARHQNRISIGESTPARVAVQFANVANSKHT